MRARFAALSLALFAPSLAGQAQVWIVDDDPGPDVDFSHPVTAAETVPDGDVLLVRKGTYGALLETSPPFGIKPLRLDGKSLAIVAELGHVSNLFLSDTPIEIENLAPGQTVTIRGMRGVGSTFDLRNNAGAIWIEDVDFGLDGAGGTDPRLYAENCAAVTVFRSTLQGEDAFFDPAGGSSAGLEAKSSSVYVYESTLVGGGPDNQTGPQPGARVSDGSLLFAADTQLVSGGGGIADLHLTTGSPQVWLLSSNPTAQIDSGTVSQFPGTARTFTVNTPKREGSNMTMSFTGEDGDVVLIGVSLAPGGLFTPAFQGAVVHFPVPAVAVLAGGTISASGELDFVIAAPPLDPVLEGVALYPQVGMVPLTGSVVLGSGSMILLLDDGI